MPFASALLDGHTTETQTQQTGMVQLAAAMVQQLLAVEAAAAAGGAAAAGRQPLQLRQREIGA
jgi:hypothetical protein